MKDFIDAPVHQRCPFCAEAEGNPGKVKVPDGPEAPPEEEEAPEAPDGNTGLIIDARGLGLSPAMAPKVVDEADKLVYGAKIVSREAAVTHGIAVYEKDLETAKKNDRIGDNPLVIKGTKAKGRNKTNVVVSDDDGAKARKAAEGQSFLNQCKVVVVVD